MISKTCGYAIRGIVFLSLEQNKSTKHGILEIAEDLQIPQHFLGKILQDLVRRGIISSIKGPHGGFFVNAKTGYKVLVFPVSKKAILYDPVLNKIIEVAPFQINEDTKSAGQTKPKTTQ